MGGMNPVTPQAALAAYTEGKTKWDMAQKCCCEVLGDSEAWASVQLEVQMGADKELLFSLCV